jgi:hypothetical protein
MDTQNMSSVELLSDENISYSLLSIIRAKGEGGDARILEKHG